MPEKSELKQPHQIPNSPGIYKMLNEEGEVIYVGKAKNLSKRIKQYFQKNYEHSTRTKKLLEKACDIKTIAVDSELEATILEHNVIKQLQPKYNVIMKDDKNFVYIKITQEDFPRIQIVRRIEKDNAKYIGPKTASNKVKETFKVLKKIFPFRHCGLEIEMTGKKPKIRKKTIKYPCLDYYIKRCVAPCIGNCTKEEYRKIIKSLEDFLQGKAEDIKSDLKEQMMSAAAEKKFEKAGKIRDKLQKIEEILEKQKVADAKGEQKDVINYCITQNKAYFNLFQIRDGKLIGQENFILNAKNAENTEGDEILEAFLKQYYEIATDIPKEILIPHTTENIKHLEEFIRNQTKMQTKLTIPQKGIKNKLLEMSANNARIFADRNRTNWQKSNELTENATKELQKLLKIKTPLSRIECYDISHLSGTNTVGSMVVFEKGAPKKDMYRKFRIKTVNGKPDDYKSMEEILYRRFSKIALEAKFKDYKFKKACKKDFDFIKKHNKEDSVKEEKQFYITENKKEAKGFIAITEHNKKTTELTNLWIKKEERGKKLGHFIIKKALEKSKTKQIYIACKPELKEYYMKAGFEELKKVPEEIKRKGKAVYMIYIKTKHKTDKSFSKTPNLVVIDGGKGQLSSANKIFEQLRLDIPRIALAKRLEEIFIPEKTRIKLPAPNKNAKMKTPAPNARTKMKVSAPNNSTITKSIVLEKNNEALKLLQRARDEAHRFAISYQKTLRDKIKV